MFLYKFIKRFPVIFKPLLFLYNKYKYGKLVRFWYSTHISPRCYFEGLNMVAADSSFYGKMGLGSYISRNTHLNADIGRFTSIGPNVKVVNATHPMKPPFITTCPLFYSLDCGKNPQKQTFAQKQLYEEFRYYDKERFIDVKIGNDCWIGEGVTIIGGTEICDGAVVLAGAYVVKNVPSYAVVGGVPAKVIAYRYDEEKIRFLQKTKWWNKNVDWFVENWEIMCDVEKYIEYFIVDT